jgi:hypothetical protein
MKNCRQVKNGEKQNLDVRLSVSEIAELPFSAGKISLILAGVGFV